MPRYADPSTCPGCREGLPPGSLRCPSCRLTLTGPVPRELFATLTHADELVSVLRGLSVAPVPGPSPQPLGFETLAAQALQPAGQPVVEEGGHARPETTPGFRLTGAAVPRILLGLGAVCLLVAAAVFSVVAWAHLGLGGRTLALGSVTVLAGGAATWSVARALAAAAEALTVVTAGLVVLDLAGAARAGWLGDPTPAGLIALVSGVLVALGTAAALAARRSPRPRLIAAEVVAAVALVAGSVSGATLLRAPDAVVELVGLVVAGAMARAAYRLRLWVVAAAGAGLAVTWWAALLLDGLLDALAHPSLAGLLGQARVWPVLVAAVALGLPAALPELPQAARTAALGGSLAVLAVVVAIPATDEPLGVATLVAVAVLAAVCAAAVTLPRRWAPATAAPAALAGPALAAVLVGQVAAVVARLATDAVWSQPADAVLPSTPAVPGWPGLLLPALLALGTTIITLARLVPGWNTPWRSAPGRRDLAVVATVATGLGGAATVAAYAVPRWWVLGVLVLAVVLVVGVPAALGTAAVGSLRPRPVGGAALLIAIAVVVALPSAGLSLVALTLALVAAVAVDLAGDSRLRPAAQAALPAALGALVADVAGLSAASSDLRALLVVVAVGLVTLARPTPATGAAGALTALSAVALGTTDPAWLPLDLVAAGALTLAAALLHRRPPLVWAGAALLLVGGWARLAETGVTTVDAYTLPPAAVLLALGVVRMHRHGTDSLPALAPGLALAMAPTLVLALGEPVSLRALALGLACTALVVVGAGRRLAAPLLFGAGAGLLLVLRQTSYADVVPQWAAIGAIGVLLTVLGITWERRLHDLRMAAGYLRALR